MRALVCCLVIVGQVVLTSGPLQAQEDAIANQAAVFKRMASKALLAGGVVNPPVGLDAWVEEIESAGSTDHILEALKPSDTKNSSAIAAHALACQLLGKRKDAIAGYRAVLKIRSKYSGPRLRLFLLTNGEEEGLLESLSLTETAQLGSAIVSQLDNAATEETQQATVGMVLRYLRGAKGLDRLNISWVLEVSSLLDDDPKFATTQRELHHAMLGIPSLAGEGFSRLLPGASKEEAQAWAIEAAVQESSAKRTFRASSYGLQGPPFVNPIMRAIRDAWQNHKIDWLTSNVLPRISGKPGVAKFQTRMALYQITPEDFLEHAMATANRMATKKLRTDSAETLSWVVTAWNDRKLSTDLTPLFADHVSDWLRRDTMPTALADYAIGVQQRQGSAALATWLESMASHFEIPLSEPMAADDFKPPTGMPTQVDGYFRLLQAVSGSAELTWEMLAFYESRIAPIIPLKDVRHLAIDLSVHPLRDPKIYADLIRTTKLLRQSPFLADLLSFRTFPRSNGLGSFFADVVTRLVQLPAGKQRLYQAMLTNEPPSFGRDLMIAAVHAEAPQKTALLLVKRRSAIENAPLLQQRELSYYVNRLIPAHHDLSEFAKNERDVLRWLRERPNAVSDDAVSTFLSAPDLQALGWSVNQMQTQARDWMRGMDSDRATLEKVFQKSIGLIAATDQDPTTFGSELLVRVLSGSDRLPLLDACLGLLALSGETSYWRKDARAYANPVLAAMPELQTEDGEEIALETALASFHHAVGKTIRPELAPLLFDSLWACAEALAQGDERRYYTMVTWLNSEEAKAVNPSLSRWFAHVATLQWQPIGAAADEREDKRIEAELEADDGIEDLAPPAPEPEIPRPRTPELAEVWQAIGEALRNDHLSATARLSLSESLFSIIPNRLPDAQANQALATLEDCWSADLSIPERSTYVIVSALESRTLTEDLTPSVLALTSHWNKQGISANTDGGLASSMLELALHAEDTETVGKIFEAMPDYVDFDWLEKLVRHGEFVRANGLLVEPEAWRHFDWAHNPGTVTVPEFREVHEDAVPTFVQQVPNKTMRPLADAWFAALSSPPRNGEKVEFLAAERAKRLQGVAGRHQKAIEALEDMDVLDAILSILSQDTQAMSRLRAVYAKRGGMLSFAALDQATQPADRARLHRVWTAHLRLSLANGPAVMQAELEQAMREENKGRRRILLPCLEQAMMGDWKHWDAEVFEQNATLIPMATDLSPDRWIALGWALSLLPEKLPGVLPIPARVRRAPKQDGQVPPIEAFFDHVFTHLQDAVNQADLDEAAKASLTEKLSTSEALANALRAYPKQTETWLASVMKWGWIKRDALVPLAAKWAAKAPRQGWAWREAANLLSAAGEEADALKCWDEAVKFAGDDSRRYSVYQLGRINSQLKLNLLDDAAKAIKAFDRKRLDPDYKDEYEFLKKRAKPVPGRGATAV